MISADAEHPVRRQSGAVRAAGWTSSGADGSSVADGDGDLHIGRSSPHSKRVLLVEDDESALCLMRMFLQAEGYRVLACSCAAQALDRMRRETTVDLLVTDFEMPGMNGFELATAMTERFPALPVVIVSGAMLGDEMLSRIADRCWQFVAKPFEVPKLIEQLSEILSGPKPAAR